MRVYVPLTLARLEEARSLGKLGSGPVDAYAVTSGLREWYVSHDIEELEYAALTRAAQASLRQLALDPDVARRRVVLAMDLPDGVAVADQDRSLDASASTLGEVRISGPVPMSTAAAVHVDGPEAEADVLAAVEALGAADQGDDDARFVLDAAEDHELLWYGVQELPQLLE